MTNSLNVATQESLLETLLPVTQKRVWQPSFIIRKKIAISILVSELSAKFWKTFYIRFRATLNHQKIELCDSELFIIIFVKLCIKIDLDIACCSSGGGNVVTEYVY